MDARSQLPLPLSVLFPGCSRSDGGEGRRADLAWYSVCMLLLLLFAPMTVLAGAKAPSTTPQPISKDAAITIATDALLDGTMEGVRLHVSSELLPPQTPVRSWHEEVFTTPASGWLIFIDLVPQADWEHPCIYAFVEENTGTLTQHRQTAPPFDRSPELSQSLS